MSYNTTKELLKADLDRVNIYDRGSFFIYLRYLFFNSSFKFCFWFRWASFFRESKMYYPIYAVCWMMHRHYKYKFGYDIPIGTKIGGGMCLKHYGAVVVNERAVIGRNCTIYQGVTIGVARVSGDNIPVIGDNCVLSAGSKVLGKIKIGDNVMIGANAVATKDIESESIVVGNPAKVINKNGKIYTEEIISHK